MRTHLAGVGNFSSKSVIDFDVLINPDIENDDTKLSKMKYYLQEYKIFKMGMWQDSENSYENLDSFVAYLRKECYKEISSNDSELANLSVQATYGDKVSMIVFPWDVFPSGLLENIKTNSEEKISFPVQNEKGEIEYLWNKYSIERFFIGE
jgi:hypothetical protein